MTVLNFPFCSVEPGIPPTLFIGGRGGCGGLPIPPLGGLRRSARPCAKLQPVPNLHTPVSKLLHILEGTTDNQLRAELGNVCTTFCLLGCLTNPRPAPVPWSCRAGQRHAAAWAELRVRQGKDRSLEDPLSRSQMSPSRRPFHCWPVARLGCEQIGMSCLCFCERD